MPAGTRPPRHGRLQKDSQQPKCRKSDARSPMCSGKDMQITEMPAESRHPAGDLAAPLGTGAGQTREGLGTEPVFQVHRSLNTLKKQGGGLWASVGCHAGTQPCRRCRRCRRCGAGLPVWKLALLYGSYIQHEENTVNRRCNRINIRHVILPESVRVRGMASVPASGLFCCRLPGGGG